MTEPRKIFLGTVTVEGGASAAFDIPDNLDPEEIRAILERVEAKRAADALAESKRLRALFLADETGEAT